MHKITVLSGLTACVLLFTFTYRPARNFIALLMVPVGDQGINIITLELAILKNPNNAAAYYGRGLLYSQGVDSQAAIEDFTRVILINSKDPNQPDVADGYRKRGYIYQSLGDNKKAIADYRRATDLYREQGKYPLYERMLERLNRTMNESKKLELPQTRWRSY